uniref:Protein lingerer n=1 Tax=Parastrongyloides trichosuri TaxID=131310 RepID=A0A0N4ZV53_PARTI
MGAKNEFSDMKSNKGIRNRNNQPRTMKELIKSVVETAGCSDERAEAALKDHQMCLEDAILEIVAENGQESWVEKKSKKTKKQDVQEDVEATKYDRFNKERFNTGGTRGSNRRGRGGSTVNDRSGREDTSSSDWKTGKDVNFDNQPSDENQGPITGSSSTFRGGRGRGRGFSGRGGRGGPTGRGGSRSYGNHISKDNSENHVSEENEELNWSSGPLVFTKKDEEKVNDETVESEITSAGTSNTKKLTSDQISYSSVLKPKQTSTPYMTFTSSTVKSSTESPASQVPSQATVNNAVPNKAGTLSFAQVLASKPKQVPPSMCKDKNTDHCKHTDNLHLQSESDTSKISTQSVYDENQASINMEHETHLKDTAPISSSKTAGIIDDNTGHQAHAWTNQLKKDLGIPGQNPGPVKSPKTQKTLDYVNDSASGGNIYGGQFESFNNEGPKSVNESVLTRRNMQQEVSTGGQVNVGVESSQKQGSISSNTYSNNIHQQANRASAALSYVDTSTMSFPPNERSLPNSKTAYGVQPGNSQQQAPQNQPQQHQMYNPPAQQAYSPYSNVPYYNMNLFNPVSSMRTDDPQYAAMFQFPLNMAHLDLNSLSNLMPTMNSNSGAPSAHTQSTTSSHQRHNEATNSFNDFRAYSSNMPNTATSTSVATSTTQQRTADTSTSVAPPPGFNAPPNNMAGNAAYFTQPSSYQNLFQYPPAAFHQHQQYPFNMMFQGGGPKMANQMVPHQVEESNDIRLTNQQPKRNTYGGHQGPVDYSNVSNTRDRERGSNSNVGSVQNTYSSQSYNQMRGSGGGHHQQSQNDRMMQPKSNYNSHHWNT